MPDVVDRRGYWLAWDDQYYFVIFGENCYTFKIPKDAVVDIVKRAVAVGDGTIAIEWELRTKGGYVLKVKPHSYRFEPKG